MSAVGQKRTLFTASLYVRFTPESGHSGYRTACPLSANSGLEALWAEFLEDLGTITSYRWVVLNGQDA